MSERSRSHLIERTNHTAVLYNEAFGRVINSPQVNSILDVGAGDSDFAQKRRDNNGQQVIRLDADYGRSAPQGDDWLSDQAEKMSLADSTVDVAISAFMMQHLSAEEQAAAITEMLRVTKPHETGDTGLVGIFPVYRTKKLYDTIHRDSLHRELIPDLNDESFRGSIQLKKLQNPTLWIVNRPRTKEQIDHLVGSLVATQCFNRRRKMRDRARQIGMRAVGDPTRRVVI